MKKAATALLVVLAFMAGCTRTATVKPQASSPKSQAPTSDPNLSGGDRAALLEGFPLEVLPLYQCAKVTLCNFEKVESDRKFALGTDVYMLRYETSAEKQDVFSFYDDKVIPTQEIAYEDSLTGRIGDNPVDIALDQEEGAPLIVTIQIGLTDTQKKTPNPYFANYEQTVLALDDNTLYSTAFERTFEDRLVERYITTYTTRMTAKDFTNLYQKQYGKEEGFTKEEDSYGLSCRFVKNGNEWTVYLTKPHEEDATIFLTIVSTQLSSNRIKQPIC